VVADFKAEFPTAVEDLVRLPGIGPSTAAAIASICFSQKAAIMDGNVARVLTRYLGFSEDLSASVNQRRLKQLAQLLLPSNAKDMPTYTQGIMDLGATVCTPKKALCEACPVQATCYAHGHQLVSALPHKTKKIKRKHKSIYWLIALNASSQVLGGKRALGGIWAGMHAFPEFESEAALVASLPAGAKVQALSVVQHELTHLSLSIHGFLWQDRPARSSTPLAKGRIKKPHEMTAVLNPAGFQWMGSKEWSQVGRPKPVSDFLAQVEGLN
jgi:A/G-specific adenine glycosylase